jgi:hypothetical protein
VSTWGKLTEVSGYHSFSCTYIVNPSCNNSFCLCKACMGMPRSVLQDLTGTHKKKKKFLASLDVKDPIHKIQRFQEGLVRQI